MAKSADAFRTISEVADWLETPAHVLRFWESKFSQLKPVKRAGGRRYYRPTDMLLLGGIKKLLHVDGMTIKGVQKLLRENGVKHVAGHSQPLDDVTEAEVQEAAIGEQARTVSPPAETVAAFQSSETGTPATGDGDAEAAITEAAQSDSGQQEQTRDTTPDPENVSETVTDTDATPASEVADDALESDVPVMPSFSHRPAPTDTKQEEQEADATAATPAIATPDLPDDPADDIDAAPGVLAQIADIRPPISDKTAERLSPILDRLRENAGGNGSGEAR